MKSFVDVCPGTKQKQTNSCSSSAQRDRTICLDKWLKSTEKYTSFSSNMDIWSLFSKAFFRQFNFYSILQYYSTIFQIYHWLIASGFLAEKKEAADKFPFDMLRIHKGSLVKSFPNFVLYKHFFFVAQFWGCRVDELLFFAEWDEEIASYWTRFPGSTLPSPYPLWVSLWFLSCFFTWHLLWKGAFNAAVL